MKGFNYVSEEILKLSESAEPIPRELRTAFDEALIHDWPATGCRRCSAPSGDALLYSIASHFFELGRNAQKQ